MAQIMLPPTIYFFVLLCSSTSSLLSKFMQYYLNNRQHIYQYLKELAKLIFSQTVVMLNLRCSLHVADFSTGCIHGKCLIFVSALNCASFLCKDSLAIIHDLSLTS